MQKNIFLIASFLLAALESNSQVTRINNNNSLFPIVSIGNGKILANSANDNSLWSTDGTLAGTIQISPDIQYGQVFSLLSGKVIFTGSTVTTGSELYITDGTSAGTILLKDIEPGTTGSAPGDMVLMNGFVYFTAETAAEGRELWRTDGTPAGTTLVKDIIPGAGTPFDVNATNQLFSTGTYLLFAGNTPSYGVELYISDGTSAGTTLLKDINPTGSDSSKPRLFFNYNNMVLFAANDGTHGEEIWETDGTPAGTVLLKDINVGPGVGTRSPSYFFDGFHLFNNKVYFNGTDGASNGEIWSTDGTSANTVLLKDVLSTTGFSVAMSNAINLSGKFIFPISDGSTREELWQSDGTSSGTTLLKSFSTTIGYIPVIFTTQPLFEGNKFFFVANEPNAEGGELWISDGTTANTTMVKDINPGSSSGVPFGSHLYTTTTLFFSGDDGVHGNELWKTDGTNAGTSMVADINPNGDGYAFNFTISNNGKIVFTGTDGDDFNNSDLFAIDGTFSALPIKLSEFTVNLKSADALVQWTTLNEINTKDFTIQRSYDGQHFENIGSVAAAGSSATKHSYSFLDEAVTKSNKEIIYYRIISLDKDGKSETSNIIFIRLKRINKWDVKLFTNPVHTFALLFLSGITQNLDLSVKDLTGKIVYKTSRENINGQINIPVAILKPGMYILVAETNNERRSIKFIKQ